MTGSSRIGGCGAAAAGLGPPEPGEDPPCLWRPLGPSGRAQAPAGAEQQLSAAISARCSPERTRRAGGHGQPRVDLGGLKGWARLRVDLSAGLDGAASVSPPAKGCELCFGWGVTPQKLQG